VWGQIHGHGLDTSLSRLQNMRLKSEWRSETSFKNSLSEISSNLYQRGWKTVRCKSDGGTLLFAQKGAYSRIGVYIVHASLLVICIGAVIGRVYGFKGNILIPETGQIDTIALSGTNKVIDFGFAIRCDSFAIEFYPSGMVKEYRSQLTILESGKELFSTAVEVNSPLTYKGITFYQSSYEGYNNFIMTVTQQLTAETQSFSAPFQEKRRWQEKNLSFGVINAEVMGQSVPRMKMWVSDGIGAASVFWLQDGASLMLSLKGGDYLFTTKQMYATGLQVNRDPGVWVVYGGCMMMLTGLLVAFFWSHRRIWLFLKEEEDDSSILMCGSANKNRLDFEKSFNNLAAQLQKS